MHFLLIKWFLSQHAGLLFNHFEIKQTAYLLKKTEKDVSPTQVNKYFLIQVIVFQSIFNLIWQ